MSEITDMLEGVAEAKKNRPDLAPMLADLAGRLEGGEAQLREMVAQMQAEGRFATPEGNRQINQWKVDFKRGVQDQLTQAYGTEKAEETWNAAAREGRPSGWLGALLKPFYHNGPRWGGIIGGLIGILPAIQIMNSVSSSYAEEGPIAGIGLTLVGGALIVGLSAWAGNHAADWLQSKASSTPAAEPSRGPGLSPGMSAEPPQMAQGTQRHANAEQMGALPTPHVPKLAKNPNLRPNNIRIG